MSTTIPSREAEILSSEATKVVISSRQSPPQEVEVPKDDATQGVVESSLIFKTPTRDIIELRGEAEPTTTTREEEKIPLV